MTRRKVLSLFAVAMTLASVTASARSTARGTRTLTLDQAASLKGTSLPAGTYRMKWETSSPDATVTFASEKNGQVVATAQAKMVERGARSEGDSVVYDTRPDGSRFISEIRIGGTTAVLVFN